jgi:hypothetical protein
MGPDKILSIDGGGAAFAHTDIGHHVDTWSPGQRIRREPPLAVALSKYALPHIPAAVAAAAARTAALRRCIPDVLRRLSALGLTPWAGGGDAPPGWRFVPIRLPDRETFERLRHAPESGALEVRGPAPLDSVAFLEGRTVTVPEAGARNWWVLLDPIAALTNPSLTEQWAARARS